MCLSYSAKYIWFGIACCSRDVLRGRNKATTSLSRTALTLNWEPFSISSEKIINNCAIIFKTFQSIIRLPTHEFYKSVAFSYHKVSHQQHSILENTFDHGLFLNKNWYSCSLGKCFQMENYVDFSYRANLLKSWNEITCNLGPRARQAYLVSKHSHCRIHAPVWFFQLHSVDL